MTQLPGSQVTDLVWFDEDLSGPGVEDLIVLTDLPGGFDLVFFDAAPVHERLLGFDVPSAGARVVEMPGANNVTNTRRHIFVSRHPDGVGTDQSRMYFVSGAGQPFEFLLPIESSVAPYRAFAEAYPPQALP